MSKKNFQKTPLERAQHEKAVKVRKMADSQLCEFLDTIVSEAKNNKSLESFLKLLEKGNYREIGSATVAKIRNIALKEGFIEEV